MQSSGIRPWLREQLAGGRVCVTREELRAAFPDYSDRNMKQAIARAVEDCILAYGWQNFYLLLPPAYMKRRSLPPTLYIDALMNYLGRPYCVALLNAAEIYGAAHQRPQTFTVMTSNPPPRARKGDTSMLEFVTKREFNTCVPSELIRSIKVSSGYIKVSTPEFTALSLVQYHKAAGGLSHVLTVLEELVEECRFDTLPDSITNYVPASVFQRLGYLLENTTGDMSAGAALHEFLFTHYKPQAAPLLTGTATSESSLDKRWRLYLNAQPKSDQDDT